MPTPAHTRRRRPRQAADFETLDVSPLIDVSFLLLIFFLVTATISKSEFDLKTTFPGKEERPEPPPVEIFTVEVGARADGAVEFEGRTVATDPGDRQLAALVAGLEVARGLADASGQPVLARIDAEDEVSHQRFTDLINALAAAGIENVAIAGAR